MLGNLKVQLEDYKQQYMKCDISIKMFQKEIDDLFLLRSKATRLLQALLGEK